jgi:catechol 2,3-dioxygenase-like lactoylglutathione lyase family enzyme
MYTPVAPLDLSTEAAWHGGIAKIQIKHRARRCAMFHSNNSVAIHLPDITAAENFYTNIMKFRLLTRSEAQLEYDTGHFHLYVDRKLNTQSPIPNFTVKDIGAARKCLLDNGCIILREDKKSLYFRDPFGITYDVIEGK